MIRLHGNKFTSDFESNQEMVSKLISTPSKILKNKIAGYVTKLIKKSKESEEMA